MNRIILEFISLLAAPLLMAAASRKKKSVKKKVRRATRVKRVASHKRAAPRANQKKPERPPLKKPTRAAAKVKPAPPPRKPVEEDEPLVKPIAPFGRAILLVPKDGTYVDSFHPTFRWLSVGGATRYEVQWSEDMTLAAKHASISLATEATVPVEKPLRVGALYFWRVRGGNDGGWGPWSPIGSFRVLEETPS